MRPHKLAYLMSSWQKLNNGQMTTFARPYALAAFEYALAKNELAAWEILLNSAATLTDDADMQRLLGSPKMTAAALDQLYCDVLASVLDTEKANFIHLLAQNKRLPLFLRLRNCFVLIVQSKIKQ